MSGRPRLVEGLWTGAQHLGAGRARVRCAFLTRFLLTTQVARRGGPEEILGSQTEDQQHHRPKRQTGPSIRWIRHLRSPIPA